MDDIMVETTAGKIRGGIERGVFSFKNVPYGGPTSGVRRWLPPIPPEPWKGVHDTTEYGSICCQTSIGVLEPSFKPEKMNVSAPKGDHSEDCLALNLWTPSFRDNGKRPVFIWIHGGGFELGSGNDEGCNGANISKRGNMVVISVNHRLNVFGYLYLADIFGKEYSASGSAGILDLVRALEWVRDNIAQFGGNPGNVTIAGQSGGGAKVCLLMAMPSAKGLFHKAIIQSGVMKRGMEPKDATEIAERLITRLDIKRGQVEKLQKLPAQTLLDAATSVTSGDRGGFLMKRSTSPNRFSPVKDGYYIPVHPFYPHAAPTAAEVPIIIGTNRDETAPMLLGDPLCRKLEESQLRERLLPLLGDRIDSIISTYKKTRPGSTPWDLLIAITSETMRRRAIQVAEIKRAASTVPVYMYLFTWESDYNDNSLKAGHGLEIPFAFDNIDIPWAGMKSSKYDLATNTSEAWISFALNGNPSHPSIPKWKPFTKEHQETMIINIPFQMEDEPLREEFNAWAGIEVGD